MEKQAQPKFLHIALNSKINMTSILRRQENHFEAQEELLLKINISEGKIVFNQEDHIVIGSKTISWYMSRVGEFYYKSNDDFDAKHIGKDNIFRLTEIKEWRTIAVEESCYLEVQL